MSMCLCVNVNEQAITLYTFLQVSQSLLPKTNDGPHAELPAVPKKVLGTY